MYIVLIPGKLLILNKWSFSIQGAAGEQGIKGEKGDEGKTGPSGQTGFPGLKGEAGVKVRLYFLLIVIRLK